MTTTTFYLITIGIYVVSGIAAYAYMKAGYSSNGIYKTLKPTWFDIVFVLCPGVNTATMFFWLFEWPYENKNPKRNTRLKNIPSKFFNINNKSHD